MVTITFAVVSLKEAASEFGVGKRTLERLLALGKLERYRRAGDRRVFVDRDQVKAALGFQRVDPKRKHRPLNR